MSQSSTPDKVRNHRQSDSGGPVPATVAHGSPQDLVEHITRLGDLFLRFGLNQDGSLSPLGCEITDAAFDATVELAGVEGNSVADASCFAGIARLTFEEGMRCLSTASNSTDHRVARDHLILSGRLWERALETLVKVEPNVPLSIRPPSSAWLN